MDQMTESGFVELEHTADLSLFVWADSIEELFRQAAVGMYALIKPKLSSTVEVKEVEFTLHAIDAESLLVAFLSELVLYLDEKSLVFTEIFLLLSNSQSNRQLSAKLKGTEFESLEVQIKAVTYSGLEISRSEQGYRTIIVFDI